MDFIKNRLAHVRKWMQTHGYAAFIIPSTDPHCGEYVPAYWEIRQWISGFNGSAGTAVITLKEAALWTDSRYFIQATQQLENTSFQLQKEGLPGTPSQAEWLKTHLTRGARIALCGEMFAQSNVEKLITETASFLEVESCSDPFGELWEERPPLPRNPIRKQPLLYTGQSVAQKLANIRKELSRQEIPALLLSALDEIAWVTNLRGNDVHCNPVFLSYLLITTDRAVLYINKEKVPDDIKEELKQEGIELDEYTALLTEKPDVSSILLSPATTNHAVYSHLGNYCRIIRGESPVAMMKATKNEAEIEGFRAAMLRDGIAMVRFLKWLKPAVEKGGESELSVSDQLERFRKEQALYEDISFDTIAGYGPHGAIVHYEPAPETDSPLRSEGFLLLDSGAQYTDGTTDITRTIPLGPLTDEMKRDYTLVLKGFIRLGIAKFPEGTSGTQLDILARSALWNEGKNYLHGTGHGVGAHLCVHEGPHQIRMNYMPAPLKAGMTVTDEPGIYREGLYGIRTENTLLITPYLETEFGKFLQFEHLTLCPIDTVPILTDLLSEEETEWLNNYHETVYQKLSPHLNPDEQEWLRQATTPITRNH